LKTIIFLSAFLALIFSGSQIAVSQDEQKSDAVRKLETFGFGEKSFVDGNLYFLMYHEMAHALISEFSLPVIGREEDAADRLATLLMTPEDDDEQPEYLLGAIQGWFATANERPLNEIPWWDEHGTDQQRGFQIACLLYGNQPERFKDIAKLVDLPEDRQGTCQNESEQNKLSWDKLLEPHLTGDGAEKTAGTIQVIYGPTEDYSEQRDYLKELKLLDDIASDMQTYYKFKPGIAVEAIECGEPNAYWFSEERKIKLCYELVSDFQRLTRK
jgi:hypothetical protein